jgi:hypothetical protein
MRVPTLQAINREARRHTFGIDDIPWHQGVDPDRNWCPERLTHLHYCPSFALLTPDEKRYYNQLFAMGVCEQFILLEETLLVRGMRRIIDGARPRLAPELEEALEGVIEEEAKHAHMFRRLLALSAPDVYRGREFVIYELSAWDRRLIDIFLRGTPVFVSWVFLAALFEEKALDFYRKYLAAARTEDLDPLYREVHRFHAMEETRHLQIDHHLVEAFWDRAPRWKKRLNDWVFYWMMTKFARPERTVRRMIDLLVERFGRLERHREGLLAEALAVSGDAEWQRASYSPDALPWTFDLLDRCPELTMLADAFPAYRAHRAGRASQAAECAPRRRTAIAMT